MKLLDLPSPLWVLGTDTGVGKTHIASRIAQAWSQEDPVVYRKPFQTGVDSPKDSEVDALAVRGPSISVETGVTLRAALSPLAAAEKEGRTLDLDALAIWTTRTVPTGTRLLLEGVGGVMVPLATGRTFVAWASDLNIPAVLVARGGLGTLNHTLLSCEALMLRGWTISAVILNPGLDGSQEAAVENAALLRRFLPMLVEIL